MNLPADYPGTISIHAPAKGATQHTRWKVRLIGISIHAPAKGATSSSSFICAMYIFQSTLPRRERPSSGLPGFPPEKFQSTLPRRERLMCPRPTGSSSIYFNPRSREGSDSASCRRMYFRCISIHAPAKGATWFYAGRTRSG